MADDRDQLAVAACLDPQDAEAVLLIVVRDALDEARQYFLGRWFSLRFHADCRIICFTAARAAVTGAADNIAVDHTAKPAADRHTYRLVKSEIEISQFSSKVHKGSARPTIADEGIGPK
jgi:hypothetical protein